MFRSTLLVSALCLAMLPRPAAAAGEAEFLAGQSKACAKCALEKVSMKRRDLGGADLAGANLAKAVFHRSRMIGANFAGADLTGANLNKSDLKNVSFAGIKGQGAMFYESDLSVANFTGADLVEAKMGKARMVRTILDQAKLTEAILTGARLDDASLRGAELPRANLIGASMRRTNLEGANLEDSGLIDAVLREANLKGANLSGADLFGADLTGANLAGADLSESRLSRAVLTGANLDGVNFKGALMPDGTTHEYDALLPPRLRGGPGWGLFHDAMPAKEDPTLTLPEVGEGKKASNIRRRPSGKQDQHPACQRHRGEADAAVERGVGLERAAVAPVERRHVDEAEGEHRHLELEGRVAHHRHRVRRQQHDAGQDLQREPDGGDRHRRAVGRAGMRRAAQQLDVERGDGADQQCRAQNMGEVGERIEPGRAARQHPEAGLLQRGHCRFDGGGHGSAQFDDFACDRDPFRPHLVLEARRRIALDDDLSARL